VGNIPFGSRLAADGQHLEPDAAEQAALQEISRLRGEGRSLRGIAATLNHRAYRTRRGTAWRLESVARIWILHYDPLGLLDLGHLPPFDHEHSSAAEKNLK